MDENLISLGEKSIFGGGNLLAYMTSLLKEFAIVEDVFLMIIVPSVGLIISATAVLDVVKMKNPKYAQKVTPGSVAARMIFGPIAILLVPFLSTINESIFGSDRAANQVPRAMTYADAASGSNDPLLTFALVIVGFFVFVGWVTALRAVMAFARCGNPQQDGYQMAKAGGARLIAASVLTMFQFFLDDLFEAATGTANQFSSKLNV